MELRRLKYFVAVAEELHFGRAAARLDMAQPPLSRQIAALEKDLGVQLFDRSRSQIRLTQAGEVMLERARDMLERLDSTWREVRLIGQGGAGRLRIAFVGSATHGPMPTLIKSYRMHYPDVDLSLAAMNNAELERALIQQDIDIAIARPRLEGDDFRSALLIEEPLVLALPDNAPLAHQMPPIRLRDLAGETFVLFPRRPRPSFADHVLKTCEGEGFTPRDQVFAQDYQTAISLVSVGVGLSLVPQSVAQVKRPGVFFRPYEGHNPGTSLTIQARRDNRKPQVMNFFEVVRRFTRAPAG
ncbi:LysR family transcriptional regulator [Pseudooceanicola sp. CBS1P-1]|uniref:LysR family transcriptional regulator n=1 Tax=Pseudooceanicola albus TaxID=2692189 RepID=A0A6L7G5H4_9RHOB|nr:MULTISPECIES: LysR family transcriptional regulator [Pseudooceanicola]MBT9385098.1 LysR family transcriptional regulator [Pseudooceanicola endophyticus]MXN18610.1 LysR family transcriptional regulator [Pseudooceanicola albus]